MFCCVCNGSCNHVGNHSFCEAHGGPAPGLTMQYVSTGTSWSVAEPLGWQDETEDAPGWLRRPLRALIAAVDAWRGHRRDWRAGVEW